MDRPAVRDAALLMFRIIVGVIFVAHGYDKLFLTGLTETTGQFSAAGVSQPKASAWLATVAELVGGSLLVIGLLTVVAAGTLALLMLAAIWFVHLDSGFFAGQGGLELPLLLVAALLMIVVFGPGRASLDGVLTRD